MEFFWGFCAAAAIAIPAWRMRALDFSGAIAAIVVGSLVFGFGGVRAAILLVGFFISGSLLSALPGKRTMPSGDEPHGRSWKQVAANGLVPAMIILIVRLFPDIDWISLPSYFSAIAASTSDSWATEMGTRYGGKTRDLMSGRPVEPGVSGGISSVGLWASLGGAAFIGCLAMIPFLATIHVATHISFIIVFLGIVISGVLAALIDSVLGSTIQAKYRCTACHRLTEIRIHCHQPAELLSGYHPVTNNLVNLIASATGALIIAVFLELFH